MGIFRSRANQLLKGIGVDAEVEYAKEGFGDFTLPCFSLAKEIRRNPAEIAREIAGKIEDDEYFSKIEAVGPYLNFHINPQKLGKILLEAVENGEIFEFGRKGKMIVEHTSANPTGPLHVGRVRNSIIGDSISRILRRYGYDVKVHYFVNDVGKQVATLLWGVKNLSIEQREMRGDYKYVAYYQGAYSEMEKRPEVEKEVEEIIWRYERGDEELRSLAREYVGSILKGIEESLRSINIRFDEFVWESSLIERAHEVAEMLKEHIREEDGAYYINLKDLGVEGKEKLFLYRRDGTTLYPLRDIAYHLYKIERADENVDVLGEDHKLHFQAVKRIVELIRGEVSLRALFYSFVKLPEGRMSTRRGKVVYLDDLLREGESRVMEIVKERGYEDAEEIAREISRSAIRFHVLNVQEEKPVTFRWEEALSFEGESGPFVQYSYARASSIIRKADWDGFAFHGTSHEEEVKLLKLMARYPEIVRDAAEKLSPHIVARYAYNLASQFNQFYRDCPVLKAQGEIRETRLTIVKEFKKIMGDVLEILGMDAPEKM